MKAVLVALTGASGSLYGLRLVTALLAGGHTVHALASDWGRRVVTEETGRSWDNWVAEWQDTLGATAAGGARTTAGCATGATPSTGFNGRLVIHGEDNLAAGPASGSFTLDATVICPCSMSTVGHLAGGMVANLVHRAGMVALKEGRTLVLVPRETPLGLVELRNLTTLAEAGAVILPAMPGFYAHPRTVEDLVDHLVGKILDRLGISHTLFPPWEGKELP